MGVQSHGEAGAKPRPQGNTRVVKFRGPVDSPLKYVLENQFILPYNFMPSGGQIGKPELEVISFRDLKRVSSV